MSFSRNTQAEKSAFVLIPKGAVLPVGITSADAHINTVNSGDHKGRSCDKFKMVVQILEPGEYYGSKVKVSITAYIERHQNGSEVSTDAYGNSKKYISLMKAIDPAVTDDTIPSPESDADIQAFADRVLVGKVFLLTFGHYSFKSDEGEKITINTVMDRTNTPCQPLTEDLEEALKSHVATWKAQSMVGKESGTADGFNPDDFANNED